MGSHLLITTPICTLIRFQRANLLSQRACSSVNAANYALKPVANTKVVEQIVARRSGNYPPSLWDDDYIQSLRSVYTEESYTRQAEKLKRDVRVMLGKAIEPLDQLKLIDDLQRLGVSYHFEDVVDTILRSIYINDSISDDHEWKEDDLYASALKFRLLRQHGFHVPQDVFGKFKDETENFKQCLSSDTNGLLSLYEASYLSLECETILDEAKDFATKNLDQKFNNQNMDHSMTMQVSHAMELPLHWRIQRQESRWFVEVYSKRPDMNPTLLELAKLDFNMVQATHQEDLKVMSSWWRNSGLGENLSFARDRLMENFFWNVGVSFEPQYVYCRRMATKVNVFITLIDDVYDVYGTLDELILFTDVVKRWDMDALEQLPDYMKICYLALFNSINEMARVAFKEQGVDIIPYLRNKWADLCKAYLVEAEWYHSGHVPTLDEYLNNAWISISAPLILVHSYVFVSKPITKDALECLEGYPSIIRWSAMILRLSDDLGTSSDEMKRGDVPKSIQCYMHETGTSEEEARAYIRNLIGETWKKINKERFKDYPFSPNFLGTAMNLARMAQFMYQNGDGHGASRRETKDRVLALLIEPLQL